MRLAAALFFVASAVAADPAPSPSGLKSPSLLWNAPAPCPEQDDVLARAERLIGHGLTRAPSKEPVLLVAVVRLLPDGSWRLNVSSDAAGESERTMAANSCEELADAMALLVALSIDPDYALRRAAQVPPDTRAGSSELKNGAATAPAATPPSNAPGVLEHSALDTEWPRARSRSHTHLTLAAAAALWVGRLPGAAPGALLRAAFTLDALVFGIETGYFPAQRATQGSFAGDLSLTMTSGSLGYALFDGLLTPYAGFEVDLIHGVGANLDRPSSGSVWLLGIDAGARFSYPAQNWLRVAVAGQISALAEQARFHVEPSNSELFRPRRVGLLVGLGAEVRVY